jgi:hypothetical protein
VTIRLELARLLLIEGVFRHQSWGSQPKPAWVSVAGSCNQLALKIRHDAQTGQLFSF